MSSASSTSSDEAEDDDTLRPWPFLYETKSHYRNPRNIPELDDDELGDITAVLRGLARASYPRLDAVPTALNAYNCDRAAAAGAGGRSRGWAYFHPVTTVAPLAGNQNHRHRAPEPIQLDMELVEDLDKPWRGVRRRKRDVGMLGDGGGHDPSAAAANARDDGNDMRTPGSTHQTASPARNQNPALPSSPLAAYSATAAKAEGSRRGAGGAPTLRGGGGGAIRTRDGYGDGDQEAKYRFFCFIHKHRIDLKSSNQKAVYTISIWDREWDELTWHDTYPTHRHARRDEIRAYWATVPTLSFRPLAGAGAAALDGDGNGDRDAFLGRIRYRTVYRTCGAIEQTLRDCVAPRHTLWSVMAIGLHHANGAGDPQVGIVPDRIEVFGGTTAGLLPGFFAHLLGVVLRGRLVEGEGQGQGRNGNGNGDGDGDGEEDTWGEIQGRAWVKQFKILERLGWMRERVRKCLESRAVGERVPDWVFEVLKI
ncbi:hypothetical protein F4778DRAFT_799538 [Xylariomycetidae sp. FL2044]|nr:hypothetical protein F4778DRAFT_799538 [Xylariomycetidae sp. FL2044]